MSSLLSSSSIGRFKVFVEGIGRSDFFHKIAGTFATRIGMMALGLITTIVVARVLGPEGRGLYSVAVAVGAIGVQFGNLGLHASNTYYLSRKSNLLPELLGNSLIAGLGIGTLGVLITWIVFTIWPNLAPVHGSLLLLALVSIPLGLTYILLQSLLLGLHHIKAYNGLDLGNKALSTLLIGVLILLNRVKPAWLFSTIIVGSAISIVWCYSILASQAKDKPRLGPKIFLNSISYGGRAYLSALFSFLTLRLGLFVVQYRFGAEATGYYSVALTLTDITYLLPVVVGNLLFPRLSAMTDETVKRETAHKLARGVGLGMVVISLGIGLTAKWLVLLLFGDTFLSAVPILYGFLPGVVALSANTIYMNYFASIGMPMVTIYSPALASALLFIIGVAGSMSLMPVGVALASSLVWLVMLIASVLWMMRMKVNE